MPDCLENYRTGGTTAIAPTVGYGQAELGTLAFAMKNLGTCFERVRNDPDHLMLAILMPVFGCGRFFFFP
ncbi:MAG: hypothetical protein JEZ11_06320 [Desulfobacterales bacterium]|nr:hypothetical protein [Desulfobacterales bacterium]